MLLRNLCIDDFLTRYSYMWASLAQLSSVVVRMSRIYCGSTVRSRTHRLLL